MCNLQPVCDPHIPVGPTKNQKGKPHHPKPRHPQNSSPSSLLKRSISVTRFRVQGLVYIGDYIGEYVAQVLTTRRRQGDGTHITGS